uniref:Odorant binding protein n=1 Tax=Stomoxys calcitrans TaxID=35570 RepID=A0A1I8P6L3_STOCA
MKLLKYIAVGCLTIFILIIMNDAASFIPESTRKNLKKLSKLCMTKTNTSIELIRASKERTLPRDPNYACYWACWFNTIGIMNEDNVIHLEHLYKVMPNETHSIIELLINECGTQDGPEKCQIALNTMQCYVNTIPTLLSVHYAFLYE